MDNEETPTLKTVVASSTMPFESLATVTARSTLPFEALSGVTARQVITLVAGDELAIADDDADPVATFRAWARRTPEERQRIAARTAGLVCTLLAAAGYLFGLQAPTAAAYVLAVALAAAALLNEID
jgi:hypothetical protein